MKQDAKLLPQGAVLWFFVAALIALCWPARAENLEARSKGIGSTHIYLLCVAAYALRYDDGSDAAQNVSARAIKYCEEDAKRVTRFVYESEHDLDPKAAKYASGLDYDTKGPIYEGIVEKGVDKIRFLRNVAPPPRSIAISNGMEKKYELEKHKLLTKHNITD